MNTPKEQTAMMQLIEWMTSEVDYLTCKDGDGNPQPDMPFIDYNELRAKAMELLPVERKNIEDGYDVGFYDGKKEEYNLYFTNKYNV